MTSHSICYRVTFTFDLEFTLVKCVVMVYLTGTTGFIWCVFWMILAHDTPDDDKSIGDLEKKYIKYSLGEHAKSKVVSQFA